MPQTKQLPVFNGLCSSFDHDGDGLSVDDGDCDDENARLSCAAELESATLCMVNNDEDGYADAAPANRLWYLVLTVMNDPMVIRFSNKLVLFVYWMLMVTAMEMPMQQPHMMLEPIVMIRIINSPFDNDGDGASFCGGDCDDTNKDEHFRFDGDGFTTCAGDCDDTLSARNLSDADNDGVTTCTGDCNDFDPATGAIDLDGDGAFSCWGDCNDLDTSKLG